MEAIKRQIFVLRDTLKDIIDYNIGTDMVPIEYHVMDFAVPETAAAVVYVLKSDGELDKILADILENVIFFQPTKGFFTEGLNAIQIRVVNDNKTLVSFTETVRAGKSIKFDDDTEAQQETLIEQLLTKMGESDGNMKIERAERIAGDENEKAERNKAIDTERGERKKEIDVERQRINNLAKLQEGSTTGDAELADVRVGADGKIYENAGEAVRGQVTALKEDFEDNDSFSVKLGNNILNEKYLRNTGNISINGDVMPGNYLYSNYIKISAGDAIRYYLKSFDTTTSLISLYNSSRKFVKNIASGNETGEVQGSYVFETDGYIRICEHFSSFVNCNVILSFVENSVQNSKDEIFIDVDNKLIDLLTLLKHKGIVNLDGIAQMDYFNEKSDYYFSPFIKVPKGAIIDFTTYSYNSEIGFLTLYDEDRSFFKTLVTGNEAGEQKGIFKADKDYFLRYCNVYDTKAKCYLYTNSYMINSKFDRRPFRGHIDASDGTIIYDNMSQYSVSVLIPVKKGDMVDYNLCSYNKTISLLAYYNNNCEFIESIVSGNPNNVNIGKHTFNSDGYIRVCAYDTILQWVAINSIPFLKNDILEKNPALKTILIQSNKNEGDFKNAPIFSIIHFSDIHGHAVNLSRIADLRQKLGEELQDVVCTGDIVTNKYSDGMEWWDKFGGKPILTCIGNHDCTEGTDYFMTSDHTQEELYSRYIRPYAETWGEGVVTVENKSYYYKDYSEHKIRLIALNCFLKDGEAAEQNTWLINALNSANISKYTVIIITHMNAQNLKKINCTFNTSHDIYSYDGGLELYEKSVQNFIDEGGDFCCWLAGHTHKDYVLQSNIYPRQIWLVVTAADINNTPNSDCKRIFGDKSQDAFNIISVDKTSNMIKLIRVGQDRDRFLKHIGTLVLDYKTGNVRHND